MILPWAAGQGQAPGQVAAWVPGFRVADGRVHVPPNAAQAVIGCVLALSMLLSLAFPRKD